MRDDGGVNTRKVRFVPVALPVVLSLGAVVALGGCAAETAKADGPSSGETGLVARAAEPSDGVLVLGSTEPAELALTSSQAFFTNAPVVVLATADDEAARATAAAAAVDLAAPVLLVGGAISDGGLRTELGRLGTVAVVEVGEPPAPPGQEDAGEEPARATLGDVDGVERVLLEVGALLPDGTLDERDLDEVRAALPDRGEPETLTEVLALTEPGSLAVPGGPQSAAIATARAAGAVPLEVPQGDPRASAEVVDAISAAKALAVVGIGASFGTADDLTWRLRSAEAGDLLPSGSQLVLADGVRYVAVEADAVTSGLVAVGERSATEAVERAQEAAAAYAEAAPDDVVVPVLEVPATRASSNPGADRDYSTEIPARELVPLVDTAAAAGVLVVLRLEPGRASFDEQVAEYADLLARPTVGVALAVDARRAGEGSRAGRWARRSSAPRSAPSGRSCARRACRRSSSSCSDPTPRRCSTPPRSTWVRARRPSCCSRRRRRGSAPAHASGARCSTTCRQAWWAAGPRVRRTRRGTSRASCRSTRARATWRRRADDPLRRALGRSRARGLGCVAHKSRIDSTRPRRRGT